MHKPAMKPINGMIHNHFAFLSFVNSRCSPFSLLPVRRERKYSVSGFEEYPDALAEPEALADSEIEGGLVEGREGRDDSGGVANGFALGRWLGVCVLLRLSL